MEWLRFSVSNLLVRVATNEIVYVSADGNYSDLMLTDGNTRNLPFQLHFFDEAFGRLHDNMFVRVGKSLIVNKRYIFIIDLTGQMLIFSGQELKGHIKPVRASREALKQLKQQLDNEKGWNNG